MANIFISFYNPIDDFSGEPKILSFYESMINGLSEAGNNLLIHMTSLGFCEFPAAPAEFKSRVVSFNPDLCIFFNNACYDCTGFLDCPILVYEADSVQLYSNKNRIMANPSRYKFAVGQEISVENVRTMLNVDARNIIKVPLFTEVQAKPTKLKHNICFIGSKFFCAPRDWSPYKRFIHTHPTFEEKQQYVTLLHEFKENPLIPESEFWEKHPGVPSSIRANFNFIELYTCLSDFVRTSVLSSVADLGLGLYGSRAWETDLNNNPDLMMNFRPELVYSLSHNENIYNSSKIGINIPHIQSREGFAWRLLDIMASNACLVNEYRPGIHDRLGSFVPTYSSPYEAREVCKRLLENENLRADIVAQSNELVERKFRFRHILPVLESFTGVKLSNAGEGDIQFIYSETRKRRKSRPKRKYLLMKWLYERFERKLRKKGLI